MKVRKRSGDRSRERLSDELRLLTTLQGARKIQLLDKLSLDSIEAFPAALLSEISFSFTVVKL